MLEDLLIQTGDATAEIAAEKFMLDNLEYTQSCLTPAQARRLHTRFMLKKMFSEIDADEGITSSAANRLCLTQSVVSHKLNLFKANKLARQLRNVKSLLLRFA